MTATQKGLAYQEQAHRVYRFALVAGWSVGYFFARLHDFTTDSQETVMSYAGNWGIEGVIMAALFVGTLNRGRGRRWAPALVFAFALADCPSWPSSAPIKRSTALGAFR